jgi:hypothetical protein
MPERQRERQSSNFDVLSRHPAIMVSDLRYGMRQWRRHKVLAGIIVLLLGLGIGANAVIFSIIHSLVLKPLPVSDPQNLFSLEKNRRQQVRPDTEFYYPLYQTVKAKRDVFSSVVAEQLLSDDNFFAFERSGAARIVSTTIVSPN